MLRHLASTGLAIVVVLAATLACKGGSGSSASGTSTTTAASSTDFTVVDVRPNGRSIDEVLATEAAKAKSQGLQPFAEFSATWCPPCMAIQHTLEAHDAQMVEAFKGTYIIRLDADEWTTKQLQGSGMSTDVIPVFYALDDKGKANGRTIDGGAWGDNIPENMAPPLGVFFHGGKAK
jgi:thiol-disulfide isomerase/thioredoxin